MMRPGFGGPPSGFGGPRPGSFSGPRPGFRRDWDSLPAEKKDDKKPEVKKPAAKEPAKKPEPEKKPNPEKKSLTPAKKEARSVEAELLNSLFVVTDELWNSVRPWVHANLPRVSLAVLGSLLADEKDRPEPPAPPAPPSPRDGGRGFGDGRRPDGPPHGGPQHGGPSHGGHSFGPWGHFDPERFKETDPELYAVWKEEHDLEKSSFELGEQYRRTKDAAEKEKLKKDLTEQVAKHFDVRQKKRGLELKRFAEHLERMKASIAKRQEAKESIVKERVDELTDEDDTKF